MDTSPQTIDHITATVVPAGQRNDFLPNHFPRLFLKVENAVFDAARRLSDDYGGGSWVFYELNNGGCYMAPDTDKPFNVVVSSNYFEGQLSADAFGIACTLFALGHLTFKNEDLGLVDHYYWLRDFAAEHREAAAIFGAID